jgi:CDP-diacylglycerol--glycerol-3-phosphate 3-phosphatidyltransferase
VLAAAMVVLGAFADTVDGAVAVVTGRHSALGQVYDSVADRLTEAAWLVALWVLGAPAWLAVCCGAVAWLHEYVRACATGAGMSDIGAVTLGERPTRVLIAGFGLAFCGVAGLAGRELVAGTASLAVGSASLAAWAATVAAAIWFLLGSVGLGQLTVAVRRTLR